MFELDILPYYFTERKVNDQIRAFYIALNMLDVKFVTESSDDKYKCYLDINYQNEDSNIKITFRFHRETVNNQNHLTPDNATLLEVRHKGGHQLNSTMSFDRIIQFAIYLLSEKERVL